MNRIITYAVEEDSGIVYSRVGSEVAIPVLDYEGMTPANNFATRYELEAFSIYAIPRWGALKWTKKIPTALKNRHRAFWGFKPLRIEVTA
jgi:hypothetical protein